MGGSFNLFKPIEPTAQGMPFNSMLKHLRRGEFDVVAGSPSLIKLLDQFGRSPLTPATKTWIRGTSPRKTTSSCPSMDCEHGMLEAGISPDSPALIREAG
jgi:hypothetical protein